MKFITMTDEFTLAPALVEFLQRRARQYMPTHVTNLLAVNGQLQRWVVGPNLNKYRAEMDGAFVDDEDRESLRQAGLVESIPLEAGARVLVAGATAIGMFPRFAFLVKEYKRLDGKIPLPSFLTSQRPTNLTGDKKEAVAKMSAETGLVLKEDWDHDENWPSTETKLAQFILCQAVAVPDNWAISGYFTDTPLSGGKANTESTVYTWLERNPEGGDWWFLSHQPFCDPYYAALRAIRQVGRRDINLRLAMAPIREKVEIPQVVDAIAKLLYAELLEAVSGR